MKEILRGLAAVPIYVIVLAGAVIYCVLSRVKAEFEHLLVLAKARFKAR